MKDEAFIASIMEKGEQAKQKARIAFTVLSATQLNWKPWVHDWSIAQCLDHLVISDSSYFPVLKKITEGTYYMNAWTKYSPMSTLWGRLLKDRLREQVKKKMTAPRIFQPTASEMSIDSIERYLSNLDSFLAYISKCRTIDLDKTIIPSPVTQIITYSLRDALSFLVQHEHRHLNQAIKVQTHENFPIK